MMAYRNRYLLLLGLPLIVACAEKPVLELQEAREAIAMARDFEADLYAREEFEMAAYNLDSGEAAIADQDQAPFWSRNYTVSLEYLALAIEQAERSQAIAEANKASAFERAQRTLPAARAAFQMAYEAVEAARSGPITARELAGFDDELAAVLATLEQGERIYDAGNYSAALALLDEVQERAGALRGRAEQVVDLGRQ